MNDSQENMFRVVSRFIALCGTRVDNQKERSALLLQVLSEMQALVLSIDTTILNVSLAEYPSPDEGEVRTILVSNFPNLGLYRTSSSLDLAKPEEFWTGDAIDNLLDIYCDVYAGVEAWRRGKQEDAMWQWRYNYDYHWMKHLVDLQVVLAAELSP